MLQVKQKTHQEKLEVINHQNQVVQKMLLGRKRNKSLFQEI